jgi:hypothetical protein
MSPKKQTATVAAQNLSADEVYDLLMKDIEPELMSGMVETLEETYKGETAEQAKARAQRYRKAFAAYDRALATYVGKLNANTTRNARAAAKSIEQADRVLEEFDLVTIESDINQ